MAPIQPTGTDPGEEGQFVIRDLEIIVINKESVRGARSIRNPTGKSAREEVSYHIGYHAGLFVGKAVQL